VLGIIVGLWLGQSYPIIGLVLLIPVLGYVILVFMRNKSGEKAGPEATAEALRMTPAAGKARLFVMRKGFVGGQQGMTITIDGQLESQIRSKYFLFADLDPGEHSVKAKMSSGTESAARTHQILLAAGDIVLLDMKLNMGALQGTPDFTEIRSGVEARQMLEGCKLILWKTGV
jgi:hypothetical protein